MQGQQQLPSNIPIDQLEAIKCIKCDCPDFVTITHMKRIPPILSPNGQEGIANLTIQRCVQCGWIFNVDEWRKYRTQDTEESSIIVK